LLRKLFGGRNLRGDIFLYGFEIWLHMSRFARVPFSTMQDAKISPSRVIINLLNNPRPRRMTLNPWQLPKLQL
jgi:hypothetical protein